MKLLEGLFRFWADLGFLQCLGPLAIGVLFGCVSGNIDGPGLPGGLIIYQGHYLP